MVKAHIWVRRREDMDPDAFRDHWLNVHAPIARDGYEHLRSYRVDFVTRVPEGQEAPYDGVATLTWDDRDGFRADMASDAAARGNEDLKGFSAAFGLLFVDEVAIR